MFYVNHGRQVFLSAVVPYTSPDAPVNRSPDHKVAENAVDLNRLQYLDLQMYVAVFLE